MSWGWASLGAVALTYFLSRLTVRIAGAGTGRLIAAHLGSYLLLAGVSGLVRGGMTLFDGRGLTVYLLPQLLWLAWDVARARR